MLALPTTENKTEVPAVHHPLVSEEKGMGLANSSLQSAWRGADT